MKTVLTACFLALSLCAAQARPSPYPPVEFAGDRWIRTAQPAGPDDVARAMRCGPPLGCRNVAKPRRTHQRARKWQRKPVPGHVAPLTLAARFIRGRLICAKNVNAALAARGIRGTNSALAKSFLRWGHSSGPVPGAVAIFNRGRNPNSGHAAIVHSVKADGTVIYLNPSARRQAWVIGPYRRRPIAYRVAS